MDKSKIAIIAASFVAVVLVVAGTYMFLSSEKTTQFDRTGEWYMVDFEYMDINYDDPLNSTIQKNTYSLEDKMYPVVFDWIEDNMFSGKMENAPILGGITGGYICFQVTDDENDVHAYAEGRFYDKALVLNIISFADSEMIHVVRGSHVTYLHETSTEAHQIPSAPDFMDFEPSNGQGKYYFFDSNDKLNRMPYGADEFKFIYAGTNIALMESNITHQTDEVSSTLYSLCIFRENLDGTLNCTYAGTSKDVFYGGGLVIAEDELHSYVYSRGGKFMTYSTSVYEVDYPYGKIYEPSNISGLWRGELDYSYGDGIIEGKPVMDKNFTHYDYCFGCVEPISPEEEYVWIGSIYGNGVYIVSEHLNRHYVLFGVIDGDEMTISGFLIDSEGKYMAVQYKFHFVE